MFKYRISVIILALLACSASFAGPIEEAREKLNKANSLLNPRSLANSNNPNLDKNKAGELRASAGKLLNGYIEATEREDKDDPSLIEAYLLQYQLFRVTGQTGRLATDLPQNLLRFRESADLWELAGGFTAYLLLGRETDPASESYNNTLTKYLQSLEVVLPAIGIEDFDTAGLIGSLNNPDSKKVAAQLARLVDICYQRALESAPTDVPILRNWIRFGISYAEVRDDDDARQYIQQALEKLGAALAAKPNDANLLALAGTAYQQIAERQPDSAKKQNLLKKAENVTKKLLESDGFQPQYVGNLVEIYKKQGEVDTGIAYFQEFAGQTEDKENEFLALKAVSQLYTSTGNYTEARRVLQPVLESSPDVATADNPADPPEKARVYLYLSQVMMAEIDSEFAKKREDNLPDETDASSEETAQPTEEETEEQPEKQAADNAGQDDAENEELTEPEKSELEKLMDETHALLEKAIEQYPKFINLRIQLGQFFLQQGEMEKAEKQLQQAIFTYSDHARQMQRKSDANIAEAALYENDKTYMWLGNSEAELLHPVLMTLSKAYVERESYIKAGDIITMFWSVYFYTDYIGNIKTQATTEGNESITHPLLRAPAHLAYEAVHQAAMAYYLGDLPMDALECCIIALKLDDQSTVIRRLMTAIHTNAQRNSEFPAKLTAYHKALSAWQGQPDTDLEAAYFKSWLSFEIFKLQQVVPRRSLPENLTWIRSEEILQRIDQTLERAPNYAILRLLRAEFYDYLWRLSGNMEADPRPDLQKILELRYNEDGRNSDDPAFAVSYPPFESAEELQDIQDEARALFLITTVDMPAPDDLKEQYRAVAEQCASELRNRLEKTPLLSDALAWYAADAGATDQAIALEKRALDGTYPRAYYHLAEILLATGSSHNEQPAVEYLENALRCRVYFPEYGKTIQLLRKYKYDRSQQ